MKLTDDLCWDETQDYALQRFHILVLVDLGGTMCYRTSEQIKGINRRPEYQVRHHFHYFRPYNTNFIKALITHKRIKLAFYTNITRKNAMPLVYRIFQTPDLKDHS